METYYYTCQYCKVQFVPKRRKVQKFCSTSCRVRFNQEKNKHQKTIDKTVPVPQASKPIQKNKIDKMSVAGVGNTLLGVAAVDLAKTIFTPEHNKSATKGDIKRLEDKLQGCYPVKNLKPSPDGKRPYFDLELKMIVYF